MREIVRRHLPRQRAVWLGLLLTIVGVLSYFLIFAMHPSTRDFPWVNLPIVLLGTFLAVRGTLGWRQQTLWVSRWGRLLAGVLSVAFAALFLAYVFVISYQLPKPGATAEALEQVAPFTLTDTEGQPVKLSDYQGRRLIISFFRGYW